MRKNYSIWIFVAAVVLLPMGVYAIVKWYENRFTQLPIMGGSGHVIEDFTMLNHHGSTTSSADWNNKIIVADFFFTHCPSICPKMTRSMKSVQQANFNKSDLQLVSITVDPERDNASRLNAYAKNMDIKGNWQLLTGEKKQIYKLARNSFKVVATDGDGGPDDFIHSELLVLIDKEKRIRGYYNGTLPDEVETLLKDMERLRRED
jgi:protein SCO1/2